jgi:hypothetical protein
MIKLKILLLALFTLPLFGCDDQLSEPELCSYKIWPKKEELNNGDDKVFENIKKQIFSDIGSGKIIVSYPIQEEKLLYIAGECVYINKHTQSLDNEIFNFEAIPLDMYFKIFDRNFERIKPKEGI